MISRKMPGRTSQQIRDRVRYLKIIKGKKYAFTNEDEKRLMQLMNKYEKRLDLVKQVGFKDIPK